MGIISGHVTDLITAKLALVNAMAAIAEDEQMDYGDAETMLGDELDEVGQRFWEVSGIE